MAQDSGDAAPRFRRTDTEMLASWLERRVALGDRVGRSPTVTRVIRLPRTFLRVSRDVGVRNAVRMSIDLVMARLGVRR